MQHSLYLITVLFAFTFIACDNDIAPSQVPSVVENTFKSKFSQALDVEWETMGDDFEVSFKIDNIDYHALVDPAGNLLKYKYEIAETTLPSKIKSVLNSEYPQKNWDDAALIIDGKLEYYQVEIDGFWNDKKLMVDSLGKSLENIKYWN